MALGFATATVTMDAYIDFMAARLLESGVWTEPDAAFYPAAATPAKRVLTDGVLYMRLERIVTQANPNSQNGSGTSETGGGQGRVNEIRVTYSTTYNAGTHAQTGTIQICGIPLEQWQRSSSTPGFFLNDDVGAGNKQMLHFTWSDANGSILGVIVAVAATAQYDQTVFYCMERNTTKLYSDGFSSIFWTCFPAHDPDIFTSYSSTTWRYFGQLPPNQFSSLNFLYGSAVTTGGGNLNRPIYFHPFNGAPSHNEPVYIGDSVGGAAGAYYGQAPWTMFTNPLPVGQFGGIEFFKPAMRSQGDSKVYFQYPVYSANNDPVRRSPVAQTPFWFMCGDPTLGVNDNDIIQYTAPGPVVLQYLVKRFVTQEPSQGGGSLQVAIRYA